MPTKADFMAQITGLMGGRVAEEVMFDEVSAGASNDIQKATKIAKAMVRSWGMSSCLLYTSFLFDQTKGKRLSV